MLCDTRSRCALALLLSVAAAHSVPALEITWTRDEEALKNALLVQPVPAGVTILSLTRTPRGTQQSPLPSMFDALATYTGFDLADANHTLSLPDGVMLTTGRTQCDRPRPSIWPVRGRNADAGCGSASGHVSVQGRRRGVQLRGSRPAAGDPRPNGDGRRRTIVGPGC